MQLLSATQQAKAINCQTAWIAGQQARPAMTMVIATLIHAL